VAEVATTPAPPTGYTVRREDQFDFRSSEYADLYARADATPFQHGLWLHTLYEVLAPRRGARRLVVTVRDAEGRLALVLPLTRRRQGPLRVVEFADLGVSDYAAPVLDPRDASALLGDGGLARQIRAALGRFDLLRIERVASSPDTLVSLLAGARARRHAYHTHLVDLPGTVDGWYEGLDPHFVRHLARAYKRLRPKGDRRLRRITDPAEVEPLMERMRHFRAARFAGRRGVDLLQDDACDAFYRAAARESVTDFLGRLVALEVAGEPVAVAFGLADHTSELFMLVGYDVERLARCSLGQLIVDELVRDAIGRGQRHFDLTVGDEPYKADFGARPRPLFEVRLRRTPVGAVGVLARDAYLGARRVAKRVLLAREARRQAKEQQPGQARPAGQGKKRAAPGAQAPREPRG
ncbi:GNAT family N-acetyltransferase, partial [Georgenia ruanii]|nr:GNAT family N-acetyltransferase [Georgenia ruanii]